MVVGDNSGEIIFKVIDGFLEDTAAGVAASKHAEEFLPRGVMGDLEKVLRDSRISYRDGVLIQLAYGQSNLSTDLTRRQPGARSVAQQLGIYLSARHVPAVKDAYQNIAKNTDVLTRGNVAEFDRLLIWANSADRAQRKAAFLFACATVAASARPVEAMPTINRSALTFARVTGLLSDLLATPSGGAFQQFIVAAFFNSIVENHGEGRARVETKNLNASDRSSFAAGDVQVVAGTRVLEAFEVTANNWRTKITGASKTIRDNDLSRLHILASRNSDDRNAVLKELEELTDDVSVLDVNQVVEVFVAMLTRPQRAEALVRLYEYLDRYQPDTERVNLFVRKLREARLVEGTSE